MFTSPEVRDTMEFLANAATFIGGLTVLIGVILALRELRSMGNAQRFAGVLEFYKLLDDTHDARAYVYNDLPREAEKLEKLSKEDIKKAERAVNFLNKIVYLIDRNLLPKDVVFRMTHSMLIRLVYQLEPFIDWRESKLGARWGRRVLDLSRRAKIYHDINPLHRRLPVMIERRDTAPVLIYRSEQPFGAHGWWIDLYRNIRWRLRLY